MRLYESIKLLAATGKVQLQQQLEAPLLVTAAPIAGMSI